MLSRTGKIGVFSYKMSQGEVRICWISRSRLSPSWAITFVHEYKL